MAAPLQLQVAVTREGLKQAAEALHHWLAAAGLGCEAAYGAELALEELGSNLLRHASPRGKATRLQIKASERGALLELELTDDGPAFDPSHAPEPNLELPVHQRPIGGVGLLLVRRLAIQLTYERLATGNRLVCTFKRGGDAAAAG